MIHKVKLVIIGSGPAGCTAAIYAARAGLNPIMICGLAPGGQLTTTTEVENFPGFPDPIQGPLLMEHMIEQSKRVGTEVIQEDVIQVDFSKRPFLVRTPSKQYEAQSVIISTGAQARWLGLESEDMYKGFGVSACATCDGFFFRNKPVLVVGGGNTAVEEALHLSHHASSVTLVHRRDSLRADKVLQSRLFSNPKVSVIWNHEVDEVLGLLSPHKSVTGVLLKSVVDNSTRQVQVDGIFIAIGHVPNTGLFKEFLKLDEYGYIATQPGTTNTNIPGVFAAGDVQDRIYRQAITAAGTGCMAALDVEKYLASI